VTRPVCLITGTTHGIGQATARRLAEQGQTVVMACRDPNRAETLRGELVRSTGNPEVHWVRCDLSDLASVRACAAEVNERFAALDLLINNAATMTTRDRRSVDGIELTFATNYLGPYLLTRTLLDTLYRAPRARIVNVASTVHHGASLDLDGLTRGGGATAERFRGLRVYARSKLAMVMFTLALAERLEGSRVTANCLHPGVVGTHITSNTNPLLRVGMKIASPFMTSIERGADTTLFLATDPGIEGVSGRYFDQHQRCSEVGPAARDPQAREALWRLSARLCGLPEEHPFIAVDEARS
jgi:NAD(P)-dependent dehydrogenase (short-subunit alcohol dehydrogenase family)